MEQVMRDFLAENPQPRLTEWEYARAFLLMIPFFLIALMVIGRVISRASPWLGNVVIKWSPLGAILMGILAFVIVTA